MATDCIKCIICYTTVNLIGYCDYEQTISRCWCTTKTSNVLNGMVPVLINVNAQLSGEGL